MGWKSIVKNGNWIVNVNKTKIIIFCSRKHLDKVYFYNKKQIEIVDYFKYLGVPFTPNCKFTECRNYVVNQARKAIYFILKKTRIQKLPIDVQLDLFHNMVLPILIYSSEVWGIENNDLIIKLHVKFCKHILHCKTSTPTCMVYGEPGQIPPSIEIKCRISSKNGILILIHLKNVVVIVCLKHILH